ncbi:MAG: RNA polymerase sigma factor [Ilumatobacteraceae bacterium]
MTTADDVDTYRRHAAELIRYATVLVGPDDAPDVVADAVLATFSSRGWRDVANRRAYLYRAVLHHSASHHRSSMRRRRREDRAVALVPPPGDPTAPAVDAHRALAELTEQQRAVVYLTYWEDLAPAQIAELLDVADGTVRKQLARARDHLRRILDA